MLLIFLQITGLLLLGLGVGVFSTGLGLGGGVLMVPAFITFMPGMNLHTAKGTSLFIILLVAVTGFYHLRKTQKVRPRLRTAVVLICGAVAGGYAGAAISTRMSETAILTLFLLFLAFLMFRLVWKKPVEPVHRPLIHKNIILCLIGVVAGITGSATGTGGGAVLTPLALLSGLLPHTQLVYVANQVIIATSLAAMPAHFTAETLCERYWTVGHVALGLVPVVFIGAQAGIILGVKLNLYLNARQRRLILALVLALVMVRMLAQFFL